SRSSVRPGRVVAIRKHGAELALVASVVVVVRDELLRDDDVDGEAAGGHPDPRDLALEIADGGGDALGHVRQRRLLVDDLHRSEPDSYRRRADRVVLRARVRDTQPAGGA